MDNTICDICSGFVNYSEGCPLDLRCSCSKIIITDDDERDPSEIEGYYDN